MTDLRNQVENLKLLIASVEADLAQKHENKIVAESTEAWLLALRKNLAEVEQDTEEASEKRRELAKLLVEKITVGRNEGDGRAKVDITYRFGPPTEEPRSEPDVRNSEEFKKAHAQGGGGELLREHPRMSTYELVLEREPTGTSGS